LILSYFIICWESSLQHMALEIQTLARDRHTNVFKLSIHNL
jgi:hypothetical protein